MNPNVELTGETLLHCEHVLHRIKAKREFTDSAGRPIYKGQCGGWVEEKDNLDGPHCWVSGEAKVFGDAVVKDNAFVGDDAQVYGHAIVQENALVYGYAHVFGHALISGDARVHASARVYGSAIVKDDAEVCASAQVCVNATVRNTATVTGAALVSGNAVICGNAEVMGTAVIGDFALIGEDVVIKGDAEIRGPSHFAFFKNFWSSGRTITYTSSNKKWSAGCFFGTGEELIKKAYADSVEKGLCYEALVDAVERIEKAKQGKLFIQRLLRWPARKRR